MCRLQCHTPSALTAHVTHLLPEGEMHPENACSFHFTLDFEGLELVAALINGIIAIKVITIVLLVTKM